MKRLVAASILLSLLLVSCTLSRVAPTPSQGEIATQVNNLLTSIPSATSGAVNPPAATQTAPPAATATLVSTPTTQPTNTPLPQPTTTVQPSPTAKPTSTATILPTATLAPTSTIPASDPSLKYGNPSWTETFKNTNNWPMGDNEFSAIDIKNNTLTLTALTTTDGWRLSWPILSNFYLEATISSDNCAGSDHYGVIFRVPDVVKADQGYLFGITCDGHYYLNSWDSKVLTGLVKSTSSTAILSGQNKVNRLGILASGNQITLYVNGVKLTSVTDSAFTKGAFGLFVGSKTTSKLNLIVTKIRYWDNP